MGQVGKDLHGSPNPMILTSWVPPISPVPQHLLNTSGVGTRTGQPVLFMLGEEILPQVQSKPSLAQLGTVIECLFTLSWSSPLQKRETCLLFCFFNFFFCSSLFFPLGCFLSCFSSVVLLGSWGKQNVWFPVILAAVWQFGAFRLGAGSQAKQNTVIANRPRVKCPRRTQEQAVGVMLLQNWKKSNLS